MYIELYNQDLEHISNVDMVTFSLTKRVYGTDTFTAKGIYRDDISQAVILRLCADDGTEEYSCFVESLKFNENEVSITGLDFRSILKTESIIDFTKEFDSSLYAILTKALDSLFTDADLTYRQLPIQYSFDNSLKSIDTKLTVADYTGMYLIKDVSVFVETYLRIYEYYLQIHLDLIYLKGLVFELKQGQAAIDISLADFEHERSTTSISTNKTVATIKFESQIKNEDGSITTRPRPDTLATIYYFLTKDNQIVQSSSPNPDINNRIYPVVAKVYEDEYLAKAQFNAAYELACNRYVDNIVIDANPRLDPIDLENIDLCTLFNIYFEGVYLYSIPLAEKTVKLTNSGRTCKVKLGFKKMLLTEIIKR